MSTNRTIKRGMQSALALASKKKGFPREFTVVKVPEPTPADLKRGEVLVDGGFCCLCGTDKEMAMSPSHGAPTIGMKGRTHNGHERGGIIVAVGEGVDESLIGKAVSLKVREGGRHGEHACPECRAGREDNCIRWCPGWFSKKRGADQGEHGIFEYPGWFTKKVIVPVTHAIVLPEGVDWRLGVHGDSAAIGAKCYMEAKAVGEARFQAWGQPREYLMADGTYKVLQPRVLILGVTGNTGIHAASLMLSRTNPGWDVYGVGTTVDDPNNPVPKIERVKKLGVKYYALDRAACNSPDWETNPIRVLREKIRKALGVAKEEILPFDLIIDVCGAPGTIARAMEANQPYEIMAVTSILPEEGETIQVNMGRWGHQLTMNNGTVIGIVNCSGEHIRLGLEGVAWANEKVPGCMIDQIDPCYTSVEDLAPHALDHLNNGKVIRTGVWFGDPRESD